METTIKKSQVGKYEISVINRINPTSYMNHPYMVQLIRFTPKAKYSPIKIEWCYVFKSIEEADRKITDTLNLISTNLLKREEEKKKRRAADAEVLACDHFKVGDILVNSWGYEQTNIEFYQVVVVGRKTIEIAEISKSIVENSYQSHGMACNVTPVPDSFLKSGDKYTLRVKSGGHLSQPKSYYHIHKWSGRPMYNSWYY